MTRFITMVYCTAANCRNGFGSGKGMFNYPTDPVLRQIWIRKVHRLDKHQPDNLWRPSRYSKLCSHHFMADSFFIIPALAASVGFNLLKLQLKPGAIPTLNMGHPEPTGMVKKR
uniref:THAP domain-containing protein 1 n=1 Tax=Fundulus heteroclitus TaxID=8078 RepID=A0A3Q2PF37_FUNHE